MSDLPTTDRFRVLAAADLPVDFVDRTWPCNCEAVGASHGSCGRPTPYDGRFYLVEFADGVPVRFVGSDGGEPEDQLLCRNWAWVAEEMNGAATRLEAAIARAEKAEAFIESLSTGRAGTANRCTGIARTDPDYGDIACMRLANHEGDHVALCGEALAADLADARAALARVTQERDTAHAIVSSGIAQVDGLRIALSAAREQALVALLKDAHDVLDVIRQADMLQPHAYDRNENGQSTSDDLRAVLARIDAATGEE